MFLLSLFLYPPDGWLDSFGEQRFTRRKHCRHIAFPGLPPLYLCLIRCESQFLSFFLPPPGFLQSWGWGEVWGDFFVAGYQSFLGDPRSCNEFTKHSHMFSKLLCTTIWWRMVGQVTLTQLTDKKGLMTFPDSSLANVTSKISTSTF